MSLREDLEERVTEIFTEKWEERDGTVVPEAKDLKLSNDAVKLEGAVLYADMTGSTKLVDGFKHWFAAEVYKAYLHCAARVITSEGGAVTAYDGDRVMGVFLGKTKRTDAVRAALKINWTRQKIVNSQLKKYYPDSKYGGVQHTVGVDISNLFVARTGIRGSNDLVWVGRAANYAAKLSAESPTYPTYITAAVYDSLLDSAKFSNGTNMWKKLSWTAMGGTTIYGSTYHWPL
jgi:class 3 adenylate cyclase